MKYLIVLAMIGLSGCGSSSGLNITKTIQSENKVYQVTGRMNAANTGVAYDSKRNQIAHSVIDFDHSTSYLLITDSENGYVKTIDVTTFMKYPQGIAYNKKTDTFWVWGTRLDVPFQEWTDCFAIFVINQKGNLVDQMNTPLADAYPGMLALDNNGNVWLKANTATVARLYNVSNGFTLVKEIETGVDGEGIAIRGDNLFVHGQDEKKSCVIRSVNINTLQFESVESPSPYCGAEGLVFDGKSNLWVTADDWYHYGDVGANMVWVLRN